MNIILASIGIWGVIMGTINLFHFAGDPILSMISLFISLVIALYNMHQLDKNNIRNELKSIKDISYDDWYQKGYNDGYIARDSDL